MKKLAPALIGLILALVVTLVLWPEEDEPSTSMPQASQRPSAGADPRPPNDPDDSPPTDPPSQPVSDQAEDPPPPPQDPAGPAATEKGRVTDAAGRPLNARLWIASEDGAPRVVFAHTDSQGWAPWPAKRTLLVVTAKGFATRIVPPGPPVTVILERARFVDGLVVDAASGQPLGDAVVVATQGDYREVAHGNMRGHFRLALPPGRVDLLVWSPVHVSARFSELDLPTLRLPAGEGLSGRLLLADGAQPGPASIWIIDAENLNRVLPCEMSTEDGAFELKSGIAGTSVWILAGNDRYATPVSARWKDLGPDMRVELAERGSFLLQLAPGDELAAPPVLEPTSLPAGTFINTGGAVRVEAGWRYAAMAPGAYQLMAPTGPLADVEILPGQEAALPWSHVAPRPQPRLSGELLRVRVTKGTRNGMALSGATIVVSGPDRQVTAVSDGYGEASLAVPPGALTITASADGRVLTAPVLRDGDDRSEVALVLAEACVLHGQVFPNERAEVHLLDTRENELRSEQSDDAGRFRLEQIPAGDYVLLVGTEEKAPLRVSVTLPLQRPLHVHLTEDYGDCGHEH